MTGNELTKAVEESLKLKGISKTEFYKQCGITAATFSNWRNNVYFPSKENLERIHEITGLSFGLVDNQSNYPQREQMRQEMRILFDAAEGAPTSAILEAAALLMRYKEQSNG